MCTPLFSLHILLFCHIHLLHHRVACTTLINSTTTASSAVAHKLFFNCTYDWIHRCTLLACMMSACVSLVTFGQALFHSESILHAHIKMYRECSRRHRRRCICRKNNSKCNFSDLPTFCVVAVVVHLALLISFSLSLRLSPAFSSHFVSYETVSASGKTICSFCCNFFCIIFVCLFVSLHIFVFSSC